MGLSALLIAACVHAQDEPQALLSQFQYAFKTLDYELSYVRVEPGLGTVEPLRFIHTTDEVEEIVHLIYLNGPARELVRKGNTVAYYEPDQHVYSVLSSRLPVMIESLAHINISQLLANYDLVIAGKSRVAGRAAQVMRVVPKQDDMYGLYIWFDYITGLPLRIDTVDSQGDLVEQMMAVSLLVFEESSAWMKELAGLQLPDPIGGVDVSTSQPFDKEWRLGWIPEGLQVVSQDRHTLSLVEDKVNYIGLSDGVFDLSVYTKLVEDKSIVREEIAHHGATSLYTLVRNGVEVTVVGEIPQLIAAMIAKDVRFEAPSSN